MTDDNFKYIDPDSFHGKELSLHDCVADKILLENKTLRFFLSDGFWVTPHHRKNFSDRIVRTDASVVSFSIEDYDDIMVRVFRRHRYLWLRKNCVEFWDMKQLATAVNRGNCTIEFITQYRTDYEQMWYCAIRSKKKPYYRECQLHLPNTNAVYYWNNLCLDREC